MATQTTNYHLKKPGYNEAQDIAVINDNMDTVDGALKDHEDRVAAAENWLPSGNGTEDQILRSNGDGTTKWDNAATQEEIGAAVTAWLDEHATQSETYIEVEDTLSVSGAAADSKTVGDKFAELNGALTDTDSGMFAMRNGIASKVRATSGAVLSGYITTGGVYVTNSGYKTYVYYKNPLTYAVEAKGANGGSKDIAFVCLDPLENVYIPKSTIAANDSTEYTRMFVVPDDVTRIVVCVGKDYVDTYGEPVVYEYVADRVEKMEAAVEHALATSETAVFTPNYSIATNGDVGSTVDVANPSSSSTMSYAIVRVRKNDTCIVGGTGGSSPRLWCFTDNDYKILSKAAANKSETNLSLKASADGYLIVNSTKTSTVRKLIHYYYFEDIPGKLTQKPDTIIAEADDKTYVSARYITKGGIPSSTTSSNWALYIYDVEGLDAAELVMNHSASPTSVLTWSLIDLAFDDFDVSDARNPEVTTVIAKSDLYSKYTGVHSHYIDIPSGAKTLMVSCAAADVDDYPVVTKLNYNKFKQIKDVIQQMGEITHYEAPLYKEHLRWGAPAFGEYYHSEDSGTTPFNSNSCTAAEYYALLNELVEDYSSYVTVTDMGEASDESTEMYAYTFNPLTAQDSDNYKRPKIIITAGQHGFEKVAVFGLYWFIKDLLENWESNPFLGYLRNHVQLIIMPLLNPYGFDNDTYVNANGVNLNRNWGTIGWTEAGSGTSYTGSEPFSEVETQYARDIVLDNLDALFLIDFHNNGQSAPGTQAGYLWHAATTVCHDDPYFEKSYVAAKWHIDEITGHLYKDFPDQCSYAISGTVSDNNAPMRQGLAKNYAVEQGIMAETMEGGAAFIGSGSRFTSPVQHMNADLIGNWLRCLLATYYEH